jgi:hypothetical protein
MGPVGRGARLGACAAGRVGERVGERASRRATSPTPIRWASGGVARRGQFEVEGTRVWPSVPSGSGRIEARGDIEAAHVPHDTCRTTCVPHHRRPACSRGSPISRSLLAVEKTGIETHRVQTPPVCSVHRTRATMRLAGGVREEGAIHAPVVDWRCRPVGAVRPVEQPPSHNPSHTFTHLHTPSHTFTHTIAPRSFTRAPTGRRDHASTRLAPKIAIQHPVARGDVRERRSEKHHFTSRTSRILPQPVGVASMEYPKQWLFFTFFEVQENGACARCAGASREGVRASGCASNWPDATARGSRERSAGRVRRLRPGGNRQKLARPMWRSCAGRRSSSDTIQNTNRRGMMRHARRPSPAARTSASDAEPRLPNP